jgi:hypothetical protein
MSGLLVVDDLGVHDLVIIGGRGTTSATTGRF